ncbi:MAG TPA: MFS transporter [Candidatus Binatia bacterium]|jgi:MFS family permease|nr:MFS transporter [Candidatus Binatia bacterium]
MLEKFSAQIRQLRQTDSLLWLIALGHTFTHWCPATFYLLLPFLVKEMGLSYSQAGFLVTIRAAANLLVNIPAGMLVDLIGKKALLMALALLATGVPYFLVGVSQSFFWVALFMAFVGIGNYLWHPAAISTLSEKYPDKRGFAIAIHAIGPNIGESLAPLLVGVLLLSMSWRNVLFVNLIPGVLIAFILWKFLFGKLETRAESKRSLSAKEYLSGMKRMAQNPSILLLVLVAGMRSMTQQGLHVFLPIYLTHDLGLSSAVAGLYLSITQTAGMIGTPIAGSVSDRRGRKRVLTAGLLSSSIVLFVLAYFRLNWLFITGLAILGFFLYAVRPVIWAWVLDLSPKELGGSMVSFFSGSQSLLSSISPLLCGFIADRWGILTAFYFLAGSVFVANLIVFAIREEGKEAAALIEEPA